MADISTGQEIQDTAKFCPECGSPSIEEQTIGILSGDPGRVGCSCTACEWVGTVGDLLIVPFTHEMGDRENLIEVLMGDLRVVLAKHCATSLGAFLLKWGFLGKEQLNGQVVLNRRQLARYMTAISKAVLLSVFEERRKMEQERVSGS